LEDKSSWVIALALDEVSSSSANENDRAVIASGLFRPLTPSEQRYHQDHESCHPGNCVGHFAVRKIMQRRPFSELKPDCACENEVKRTSVSTVVVVCHSHHILTKLGAS
jgi:hypothetical protein